MVLTRFRTLLLLYSMGRPILACVTADEGEELVPAIDSGASAVGGNAELAG
jgi:hypothetical protein